MGSANRVVLNTGVLYVRMLLTMGISLYSTRIVLNALGAADYGIFNLIAGVIALLSFLNVAMTTSTQRYLSFNHGKQEKDIQRKIFSNSLLLHFVIGVSIVLALTILGLYLFNGVLNIPADRAGAARTIYSFMSVTIFFTVVAVPFIALLNAHENMLWIAIISVIEVVLKLLIALLLQVVSYDRLIIYGSLTSLVAVITLVMYAIYCFRKYPECTLKFNVRGDSEVRKELTSFAGWNLFGTLCGLARVQGLAVILNIFFGTIVNAAYGIANQVGAQLNFFSATLLQAINPQIMKSEGAGNRERMLRLSMIASKFCFFLLALFAIPCIFEMESVLSVWLKSVPAHTVIFCQLILIGTLINQFTIGLQSAVQATGKIRTYQTVVGSILLLNLPISYFLLKMSLPAYSVLVCFSVIELVGCIFRIYFLNRIAKLSVSQYLSDVLAKIVLTILLPVATCFLIVSLVDIPYRFFLTGAASAIIYLLSIYLLGLNTQEKNMINSVFAKFIGYFRSPLTYTVSK